MYNFIKFDKKISDNVIKNLNIDNKISFEFIESKFMEEYLKKLKYIQLGGNSTLGKGIIRVYSIS